MWSAGSAESQPRRTRSRPRLDDGVTPPDAFNNSRESATFGMLLRPPRPRCRRVRWPALSRRSDSGRWRRPSSGVAFAPPACSRCDEGFSLVSGEWVMDSGVHSKSSRGRTDEACEVPRLFARIRAFSNFPASISLGKRLLTARWISTRCPWCLRRWRLPSTRTE
jgi:hypothetical protein